MERAVVAVLDVGKTNKKLSLYSREFEVLGEERTTLDVEDYKGLEVEPTGQLLSWFKTALSRLAKDFQVRAVAITTHGATCALLDDAGKLAHPVISYTCPKGAEIQEEFYRAFGDRDTLHRATCTPDLGFANVGKILFYVKTRLPEVWARCKTALFYTSYLGYELTGKMGRECTYLGNHTYQWNFHEKTWSSVARGLGADRMFPEKLSNPWDCLGTLKPELASACKVPEDCRVTMGIHDSNANFLPYLAKGYGNFILNSTGTWCVGMRQSATPDLTDEEVKAKVFYNLDAFGNPLKTSIFPAGMEYDTFGGFGTGKDESDFGAVQEVITRRDLFIIPGVLPDASAFPGATARVVHQGKVYPLAELYNDAGKPMASLGRAYYAALDLSLALASRAMLKRCGAQKGTTVFVEGGFAKNKTYCETLAALCPDCTIALTNVKEGTSFGAALTAWMLAEGTGLERLGADFTIQTAEVATRGLEHLGAYEQPFNALLGD